VGECGDIYLILESQFQQQHRKDSDCSPPVLVDQVKNIVPQCICILNFGL